MMLNPFQFIPGGRNINPIDIDSFIEFWKTRVGSEFEATPGGSKFTLQSITDHAFYYQVSNGKPRKQNIRYVKRVLDQYAKLQSLNPGHYANVTQNAPYVLTLIKLYEKQKRKISDRPES
jgi:hypothetical protein